MQPLVLASFSITSVFLPSAWAAVAAARPRVASRAAVRRVGVMVGSLAFGLGVG